MLDGLEDGVQGFVMILEIKVSCYSGSDSAYHASATSYCTIIFKHFHGAYGTSCNGAEGNGILYLIF